MQYRSTKTYGHDLGLSACFRQWRAKSHCKFLHGYALSFRFEFGTNQLDDKGWVVDFGGLKELKERLQLSFDHTLAIAGDDPELAYFKEMKEKGLADVVIFPSGVGCERFAQYAYNQAVDVLQISGYGERVKVLSCECAEHGSNSAIYVGE